MQLYTSPTYEDFHALLIQPEKVPKYSSEVEKQHRFSPIICRSVCDGGQIVWANTKLSGGLTGRSDVPLNTAVGIPVCSVGEELFLLVLYAVGMIQMTQNVVEYIMSVVHAVAKNGGGFLCTGQLSGDQVVAPRTEIFVKNWDIDDLITRYGNDVDFQVFSMSSLQMYVDRNESLLLCDLFHDYKFTRQGGKFTDRQIKTLREVSRSSNGNRSDSIVSDCDSVATFDYDPDELMALSTDDTSYSGVYCAPYLESTLYLAPQIKPSSSSSSLSTRVITMPGMIGCSSGSNYGHYYNHYGNRSSQYGASNSNNINNFHHDDNNNNNYNNNFFNNNEQMNTSLTMNLMLPEPVNYMYAYLSYKISQCRYHEFMISILGMTWFSCAELWLLTEDNQQLYLTAAVYRNTNMQKWVEPIKKNNIKLSKYDDDIICDVIKSNRFLWDIYFSETNKTSLGKRSKLAKPLGVNTALGVPIPGFTGVFGTMMFYSSRSRFEPEPLLVQLISKGIQILAYTSQDNLHFLSKLQSKKCKFNNNNSTNNNNYNDADDDNDINNNSYHHKKKYTFKWLQDNDSIGSSHSCNKKSSNSCLNSNDGDDTNDINDFKDDSGVVDDNHSNDNNSINNMCNSSDSKGVSSSKAMTTVAAFASSSLAVAAASDNIHNDSRIVCNADIMVHNDNDKNNKKDDNINVISVNRLHNTNDNYTTTTTTTINTLQAQAATTKSTENCNGSGGTDVGSIVVVDSVNNIADDNDGDGDDDKESVYFYNRLSLCRNYIGNTTFSSIDSHHHHDNNPRNTTYNNSSNKKSSFNHNSNKNNNNDNSFALELVEMVKKYNANIEKQNLSHTVEKNIPLYGIIDQEQQQKHGHTNICLYVNNDVSITIPDDVFTNSTSYNYNHNNNNYNSDRYGSSGNHLNRSNSSSSSSRSGSSYSDDYRNRYSNTNSNDNNDSWNDNNNISSNNDNNNNNNNNSSNRINNNRINSSRTSRKKVTSSLNVNINVHMNGFSSIGTNDNTNNRSHNNGNNNYNNNNNNNNKFDDGSNSYSRGRDASINSNHQYYNQHGKNKNYQTNNIIDKNINTTNINSNNHQFYKYNYPLNNSNFNHADPYCTTERNNDHKNNNYNMMTMMMNMDDAAVKVLTDISSIGASGAVVGDVRGDNGNERKKNSKNGRRSSSSSYVTRQQDYNHYHQSQQHHLNNRNHSLSIDDNSVNHSNDYVQDDENYNVNIHIDDSDNDNNSDKDVNDDNDNVFSKRIKVEDQFLSACMSRFPLSAAGKSTTSTANKHHDNQSAQKTSSSLPYKIDTSSNANNNNYHGNNYHGNNNNNTSHPLTMIMMINKGMMEPLHICKYDGCSNEIENNTVSYCRDHRSTRRCNVDGCCKCAQGATKYCISHGGGRRCTYDGCNKGARDRLFCAAHGGGKRCHYNGK